MKLLKIIQSKTQKILAISILLFIFSGVVHSQVNKDFKKLDFHTDYFSGRYYWQYGEYKYMIIEYIKDKDVSYEGQVLVAATDSTDRGGSNPCPSFTKTSSILRSGSLAIRFLLFYFSHLQKPLLDRE